MASTSQLAAAEADYFANNPAPKALPQHLSLAQAFIAQHDEAGRRVVLVTSGGTTVPLENQTVRYIDNFSAGTRGATSAEYFLEAGYAVIFLHRQFSLLPYSRHYSHNTRSFLDYMVEEHVSGGEDEDGGSGSGGSSRLKSRDEAQDSHLAITPEQQRDMIAVFRKHSKAKRENTLLILSFVTITEYLWSLREVAKLMQPLGARALFYLAAAVSDFFVPADRMVEHKIQSSDEFSARQNTALAEGGRLHTSPSSSVPAPAPAAPSPAAPSHPKKSAQQPATAAARTSGKSLIIDLSPVPKFLKALVDGWAPEAMIVSFKLETDPALLVEKAVWALRKYSHHLVIGNLLSTRKWEVVFVSAGADAGGGADAAPVVRWVRVPRGRRAMSRSGIESLVGRAAVAEEGPGAVAAAAAVAEEEACTTSGRDASPSQAHRFVGEPAVEIESLIIPRIREMHDGVIAKTSLSCPQPSR